MREKLPRAVPIKDLMTKVFNNPGLPTEKSLVYDLQDNWEQLVGSPLHRHSQPVQLTGRRLIIGVKGSSWANELQLKQTSILKKVKETLPYIPIAEIRFKVL